MLCRYKYESLLESCDATSSGLPLTNASLSSPERIAMSPVKLRDIFTDDAFLS